MKKLIHKRGKKQREEHIFKEKKKKSQQFQSMPVAARGITEEVISSSHSSFWVFSTGLELRGLNLMQRPTFGTTGWLCPCVCSVCLEKEG